MFIYKRTDSLRTEQEKLKLIPFLSMLQTYMYLVQQLHVYQKEFFTKMQNLGQTSESCLSSKHCLMIFCLAKMSEQTLSA